MREAAIPAPDKRSMFHTLRHTLKSVLNPLAWDARRRLRRLEALAAKRKGLPRVEAGSIRRESR